MWRIVQQDEPDDYVLATGEKYSVRTFAEMAFAEVGRTLEWSSAGEAETGRDAKTGEVLVAVDPRYFRPAEVDLLVGDASKAKRKLGWAPKITFAELVTEMVAAELVSMKREAALRDRIVIE
jgi:GDPmannose 4,6-dehydratase